MSDMSRNLTYKDCVRLATPYEGKYEYGRIFERGKEENSWVVWLYDCEEKVTLPEEELTYLPPYNVTEDDLRQIVRYELTAGDMAQRIAPPWNWDSDEEYYEYTLADMEAALRNILEKKPDVKALNDWKDWLDDDLYGLYGVEGEPERDEQQFLGTCAPRNDAALAEDIFEELGCYWDAPKDAGPEAYEEIVRRMLEDVEKFRRGEAVRPWLWDIENKVFLLDRVTDDNWLKSASPEEKSILHALTLELAEEGNPKALHALGYACYGGNELFDCDWETSRDCFLKLMESEEVEDQQKCHYANTLGYIFYYGRCNDGEPEYEKAYYYYSIGAAGGIYESMYKLSDLFVHGYSVPKNKRAAEILVYLVYSRTEKEIRKGDFSTKFADAALRMGNLCRDGIVDADEYYYYTLADYAIRKRMPYDYYGDAKVFTGIQKELARIREERPLETKTAVEEEYLLPIFNRMFLKHSCVVTVKPKESGLRVKARRLPQIEGYAVKKEFECYPECGYCELVDRVALTVEGEKLPKLKKKKKFIADSVGEKRTKDGLECTFYHHGKKVFSFVGERFVRKLRLPTEEERKTYTFAGVVFSLGGHTYDYICELPDVSVGDRVVVNANGVEKEVEVVRMFRAVIGDMPLAVERYKRILRKA